MSPSEKCWVASQVFPEWSSDSMRHSKIWANLTSQVLHDIGLCWWAPISFFQLESTIIKPYLGPQHITLWAPWVVWAPVSSSQAISRSSEGPQNPGWEPHPAGALCSLPVWMSNFLCDLSIMSVTLRCFPLCSLSFPHLSLYLRKNPPCCQVQCDLIDPWAFWLTVLESSSPSSHFWHFTNIHWSHPGAETGQLRTSRWLMTLNIFFSCTMGTHYLHHGVS